MKLLYFYMKFLDDQGEAKPFRGLNEIELNLSAQDLFHYDSKNNRLERKRRTTPLPENFWVNEAVKDLDTPGHDPSKITNVNVIAGENGSGKSTVIQILIDLLDALYGTLTSRDRWPLSYHDPRPHRFLLLLEGETGQTKKDKHPLVWYLMDYSPQTTQQNSARLDNSYYKEGIKHLTFSFHDWSALYADAKSIEWKEKEQDLRARDEIKKLLTKTKVVYMTNTLNQRDFARHTSQEANQRLRDFFVYDCSLGATVGPDIAQFFPYEVYKQVKYVFDRNQRVLRQTMHNLIPELRVPHSLRLLPRFDSFSESFRDKEIANPEGNETQEVKHTAGNDTLTNILGKLCIAGFADNLTIHSNNRVPFQLSRALRFGSNPQKLNHTDLSKLIIKVEEHFMDEVFVDDKDSDDGVSCVIETNNGFLVSTMDDDTIRVWDSTTGECLRKLKGHTDWVSCIIETMSGQFVSGSWDQTLRVWDPATGECLRTLEGHRGPVACVTETKGGQLVSGSGDHTLRVWDPATGECLRTLEGHDNPVRCVIEIKGGQLVSGSEDNTLWVWDLDTGECLRTLEGHDGMINCVIETKGGQLVSGSWDDMLRVWDPATGKCLRTLKGHTNWVKCVMETKGGQLVSGSGDGTLRVWDPASGACLRTLEGHDGPVSCVIETKGAQLVSGSGDGTLRVWDLSKGIGRECVDVLYPMEAGVSVRGLDFSRASFPEDPAAVLPTMLWQNGAAIPGKRSWIRSEVSTD